MYRVAQGKQVDLLLKIPLKYWTWDGKGARHSTHKEKIK